MLGHAAHYSRCWADGSKIDLEIRGQGHGGSDTEFWGWIDSRSGNLKWVEYVQSPPPK